ncbi:MAG: fasciclin domain-containing protein [Cyclobacteriaceae bacterium]
MNFKKYIFLLAIISFFASSCENRNQENNNEGRSMDEVTTDGKEMSEDQYFDEENYSDYNFLEYIEAKENFGTMAAALKASGLLDSLKEAEEYTLFLPTDEAFDKLGEATVMELIMTDERRDELKAIIKYHLFPGELHYNEMAARPTIITMLGKDLLLNEQESGMVINDNAKVLDADIETGNGVIHIINHVLIPPEGA